MHPIIPQPGTAAPLSLPAPPPTATAPAVTATASVTAPATAAPAPWPADRISRITALPPEDMAAGLLWLAINHPAITGTMLDKLEHDGIDDELASREPEPYCARCGADIGIFLRHGLDWQHYRGDRTITGPAEIFDPGHQPEVAWRLTLDPATR